MTITPKRLSRLAALLTALLLPPLLAAPGPAAAASTISCAATCGQTFTAPLTGNLTGIRILVETRGDSWDFHLTPVDGAGNPTYADIGGYLGSQDSEAGLRWHTVPIYPVTPRDAPPPKVGVQVTAGTQYAFYDHVYGTKDFAVADAPYDGGAAFGGFMGPSAGIDLAFEVLIEPTPSLSPAPGPSPSASPSPSPGPSLSPSPSPAPPVTTFGDVPTGYWAATAIRQLAARAITTGCGTNAAGQRLFCPDRNVTRAEMAVFLDRTLGYGTPPTPTAQTFADVPTDHWAYATIEQFARLGITAGCGTDGNGRRLFCPDRNVTRAEMAVFIDRAKGYTYPAAPASATFADVPPGYWAYAYIGQFVTLKITTGCARMPLGTPCTARTATLPAPRRRCSSSAPTPSPCGGTVGRTACGKPLCSSHSM